MRRDYLFLIKALMALCFVFTISCNKDNNESNQPVCSITSPINNEEFDKSDSISVTVVIEDKGVAIAGALLFIDDEEYAGEEFTDKTTFPLSFTIKAGDLAVGAHTLNVWIIDEQGTIEEVAAVNITITPTLTESPDFVSFSSGKTPKIWKTTTWKIDNTTGYDDTYSLKAALFNATVVTNKIVASPTNFIEFYLYGSASFYIDNIKAKNCVAHNDWTKFGFYLEKGSHTLKWQSVSSPVNLDAIRFKEETQLAVGTYFQGGIIAYLDNTKQHGLIAAPDDQSIIDWYNNSYVTTGSTGTKIGTGKSNTAAIVQAQGKGFYAANICKELVINGYNDWYLPSKDELNLLYQNKDAIGGFEGEVYWSSSEYSKHYAWSQYFSNGYQEYSKKQGSYHVRAIRAF